MKSVKTIALIAHDGQKKDMAAWVNFNKETLKDYTLVGTSTTGALVEEMTGLHVEGLGSGPKGGDIRISARILDGQVDMVIFFIDFHSPHAHQADIDSLIRACGISHIPYSLNRATADALIIALRMRKEKIIRYPSL